MFIKCCTKEQLCYRKKSLQKDNIISREKNNDSAHEKNHKL